MNFNEMKNALKQAELQNNKIATLHYLMLKHAKQLINDDPKEICQLLGIKESFATEIRKMRALYLLMESENLKI